MNVEHHKKPKTALQWRKEAPHSKSACDGCSKSAQIITTAFIYRSKHDFQLFKDYACEFFEHLRILADVGYQGLTEVREKSQTPFKKSKYHALTKREKQSNRSLARERIVIEHIFRNWLKVFRISERYRNRRKRFALRFNLIAAIYNLESISN